MDIEWRSSLPASAYYAALMLLRGHTLVDRVIEAALAPIANRLQSELAACGCPAESVLCEMIGLVTQCDTEAALAETALNKAIGRSHDPSYRPLVAVAAGQLTAAFVSVKPRADDELPLRIDPLRSQWEARGPGLLAGMRRLSTADLVVPSAGLVLVHPALGGGGLAHPAYNHVTFEGLLANPVPQLPEVLRLGWLLGQLNFDLPAFAEPLGQKRLERAGSLALIPIVLAAAEDIELARYDQQHLRLALELWCGSPAAADVLSTWWETYQASRPSWPAAMAALDALLQAESIT